MPPYRGNPLDESVNTELMRVCKCIVPYLDRDIQKNVAIGLKFLELVNTINTFNDSVPLSPQLSLTRQGNWHDDLLQDIRSSLSPEKASIIDTVLKFQQIMSVFNMKDSMPDPPLSTPPSFNSAPETPENIVPPPGVPLFYPDNSFPRQDTPHPFETPQAAPSENPNLSPAAFLQALSPMLDDNQRQMLTLFSTLMNK